MPLFSNRDGIIVESILKCKHKLSVNKIEVSIAAANVARKYGRVIFEWNFV